MVYQPYTHQKDGIVVVQEDGSAKIVQIESWLGHLLGCMVSECTFFCSLGMSCSYGFIPFM